ncbi:hypothetical protein C8Q79DRAFT_569839 [Trametes meyenii]|nr:hypothetical protein C8Q79DRAFT_569839 [Trametes meyenii]
MTGYLRLYMMYGIVRFHPRRPRSKNKCLLQVFLSPPASASTSHRCSRRGMDVRCRSPTSDGSPADRALRPGSLKETEAPPAHKLVIIDSSQSSHLPPLSSIVRIIHIGTGGTHAVLMASRPQLASSDR